MIPLSYPCSQLPLFLSGGIGDVSLGRKSVLRVLRVPVYTEETGSPWSGLKVGFYPPLTLFFHFDSNSGFCHFFEVGDLSCSAQESFLCAQMSTGVA